MSVQVATPVFDQIITPPGMDALTASAEYSTYVAEHNLRRLQGQADYLDVAETQFLTADQVSTLQNNVDAYNNTLNLSGGDFITGIQGSIFAANPGPSPTPAVPAAGANSNATILAVAALGAFYIVMGKGKQMRRHRRRRRS